MTNHERRKMVGHLYHFEVRAQYAHLTFSLRHWAPSNESEQRGTQLWYCWEDRLEQGQRREIFAGRLRAGQIGSPSDARKWLGRRFAGDDHYVRWAYDYIMANGFLLADSLQWETIAG